MFKLHFSEPPCIISCCDRLSLEVLQSNEPVFLSICADANNENVAPASPACGPSPAGQQNAGAPPQFIFPLSPPNSAPGSPSPFFTTATGSAFVLPDVIANAAATAPPTNARASGAPQNVTFAPNVPAREPAAINAMAGSSPLVLDAASVREKLLRKRKRAKLTKRKKLATAACEAYEAQRKVARTGGAACACATGCNNPDMDVVMVDDDDDDESVVDPQDRIAPPSEYLLRSCFNATSGAGCTSAVDLDHVPTVHTTSCYLHQRQPSASSTHSSHPADCNKVPVCMHVGEELRKIVECFRNPKEVSVFI